MRRKVGWIVVAIGALSYFWASGGFAVSPGLLALREEGDRGAKKPAEQITLHLEEGTAMSAAASPDGKWIALDLLEDIWIIPATGGKARRLTSEPSTELDPRWSPDGRRLVFSSDRAGDFDLWVLEVASGQMTALTSGPGNDTEPDWSPDGKSITFISSRQWATGDLYVIPAEGGEIKALTSDPARDRQPAYSPDGRWIAFASNRNGEYQIWKIAAQGGEAQLAVQSGIPGFCPAWSRDGRPVWREFPERAHWSRYGWAHFPGGRHGWRGQLWIGGNSQGPARALTEPADPFSAVVRPSRLPNGELVFVADGKIHAVHPDTRAMRQIPFEATFTFTKNRFTPRPPKLVGPGRYPVRGIFRPRLSPDGTRVAFAALDDIWVVTIGNPMPVRITDGVAVNAWPAWSPDGQRIVFMSDRAGDPDLWSIPASGGQPTRLTSMAGGEIRAVFSPDGEKIAFPHFGYSEHHIYWVRKDGGEPRLVTRAEADFYGWLSQSFSPDGKRLYFLAYGPEGTRSVNVAFTPVLEAGAQIPAPQFLTSSRRVLSHLVLSADGRKLIYRDLGRLWLQELSPEGELLGQPHSLTAGLAFYSSFSADGKRLCYLTPQGLVLHDLESGNTTPIPLELDYEIPENCSSLLVRNVRLIDGTGSPPREGVDILVRNGRIARIAPTGTIPAHRVEVLDAGGKTAIPGLIDMHIHTRPGNPVAAHLYFGTTSYRDVGSPSYVLLAQVEAIRAGREIGPRVFYAGELFESPQASYAEASRLEIANEAQAIAHFERLAGLGYHVTKADPRSDSIPGPLQQVIVEQSHALGRPVTGHWNVQSILRGMDGVEHNPRPWLGGRAYDDYLQLTARSGICLTPTLQTSASSLMAREHPEILDDPVIRRLIPAYHLDGFQARVAALTSEQVQTTRADFQRRLAHLRRIRELGGKIVAGTDTRLSGLSLHWELQHYVEAGMTPMEALLAATREAAACLGYPHELGSIEEGKIADIVLLDADPLEDISNTLRIAAVIHDGRVVDREKLLRPPQE